MSKLGDLAANDISTRREYFPWHLNRFLMVKTFNFLVKRFFINSVNNIRDNTILMKTNLSK